jgi:hypothetical protein
MRIRHKAPSIFNLSMVDMLCCALGCVILVWLLNAKQAEDTAAEQREEIAAVMDRAKSEREESQRLLSAARTDHEKASARLRALTGERDAALQETGDLKKRILGYEGNVESLTKQLAAERAKAKELAGKLKQSDDRLTMLEADLRAGRTRLEEEKKKVAGLTTQAGEKEEVIKGARAELLKRESALKGLLEDIRAERDKLRAERERAEKLEKAIALTRAEKEKAEALLKDDRLAKEKADQALAGKEKVLAEVTKREQELLKRLREKEDAVEKALASVTRLERDKRHLQSTIEARFAGIELTGERVVFLVDSSGSMTMVDDKTDAPLKWVEVRRTVAKLMESLPKLSKYQLITFGPRLKYPLGSDGKWIDYKKESPLEVLKALEETKPSGGTNMYIAFDAAFGFRKDGLDTVYLLSDGLPNQGEGLTPHQSKTLDGIERGLVLGKHVRATLKKRWNAPEAGKPAVKIHTIGFFYESPDLGSFLWALARENDGSFVGMSKP